MGATAVFSDALLHLHLLQCEVSDMRNIVVNLATLVESKSKYFSSLISTLFESPNISKSQVDDLSTFVKLLSSELNSASTKILSIDEETSKVLNVIQNGDNKTLSNASEHSPLSQNNDIVTDTEYKCPECFQNFLSAIDLNNHQKLNHSSPDVNIKQETSPAKIQAQVDSDQISVQSVESSKRISENSNHFTCGECGKSFYNVGNLKRHKLIHFGTDTIFTCALCGYKYNYKPTWIKHLARHSDASDKKCDFCKKRFLRQFQLNQHIKDEHECKVEKNTESVNSSKMEPSVCSLADFESLNSGVTFDCCLCGHQSKQAFEYKQHVSTHSSRTQKKFDIDKQAKIIECIDKNQSVTVEENSDSKAFEIMKMKNKDYSSKKKNSTEQATHSCDECGRFYSSASSLRKHKLRHRSLCFTCPTCGESSKHPDDYRKHLKKHSVVKPYHCTICKNVFVTPFEGERHSCSPSNMQTDAKSTEVINVKNTDCSNEKKDRTDPAPHSCNECGKFYSSASSLKKHKLRHRGLCFICPTCGQSIKHPDDYKKHLQIHSVVKRYQCKICKKVFGTPLAGERHSCSPSNMQTDAKSIEVINVKITDYNNKKKKATGTKQAPHSCDECGKFYSSAYNLKKHKLRHRSLCFICPTCGQSLKHPDDYKKHLQKHSDVNADVKPYHCEICNKQFLTPFERDRHARSHSNDKPYMCATCGVRCKDKGNLSAHMKRHSVGRQFQCDECPKRVYTASELRKHKKLHSDVRSYQCKYCPSNFKYLNSLRCHTRTHTNERPYVCSFCNKRFISSSSLKAHKNIHLGIRFPCQGCGQAYSKQSGLRIHLKSKKETCGKIHIGRNKKKE